MNGDASLNFELEPAALSLDEVVVTGTAGGEMRRSIGNAVATIDRRGGAERAGVQVMLKRAAAEEQAKAE